MKGICREPRGNGLKLKKKWVKAKRSLRKTEMNDGMTRGKPTGDCCARACDLQRPATQEVVVLERGGERQECNNRSLA